MKLDVNWKSSSTYKHKGYNVYQNIRLGLGKLIEETNHAQDILFEEFYKDPSSDPVKVKKILNDKVRWKNPSQYLGIARNHFNLTVDQVKSHPGFAWIDPKGTAID